MILSTFILILCLSLFALAYGHYTKNDLFRYFGAGFLVLCALSLSSNFLQPMGAVQIETGYIETVSGNVTTVEKTYTDYENNTLALYLAILGAFMSYIIAMERRGIEDDEN